MVEACAVLSVVWCALLCSAVGANEKKEGGSDRRTLLNTYQEQDREDREETEYTENTQRRYTEYTEQAEKSNFLIGNRES